MVGVGDLLVVGGCWFIDDWLIGGLDWWPTSCLSGEFVVGLVPGQSLIGSWCRL